VAVDDCRLLPGTTTVGDGEMGRLRAVAFAVSLAVASMVGCAGEERPLFEGDPVAFYDAALRAVLDTIGISPDDRLLFADRYITFEELMNSEAGPPEALHDLARRYRNSRVCRSGDCPPVDGDTQVLVSRVWAPAPGEAELAVLTYVYYRGGIFGDGHRVRLLHDGRSWVVEDVQRVVVPE